MLHVERVDVIGTNTFACLLLCKAINIHLAYNIAYSYYASSENYLAQKV